MNKPVLPAFKDSFACASRVHCVVCRNLNGGRWFREKMMHHYVVPDNQVDFICPYGVPWEFQPDQKTSIIQDRPTPTARHIKSFLEAATTGKYVSAEIAKERLEICRTCEFRRIDREGIEFCGICGCKVSAKDRELNNLAAYEERLPKYGCKHNRRKEGLGWKR